MKSIIASARIQNDNNVAAAKLKCDLELYYLKTNRWARIASAVTDAKGNWNVSVNRRVPNAVYAIMLRLVESGTKPAPRVLAQHAYLKYDTKKQILNADFGVIEQLRDDAYQLTASNALFQRTNYYVAGQAQQPAQIKLNIAKRVNLAAGIAAAQIDAATATTVVRPKTRLNVLATNIGSEMDTANKELMRKRLPYQFGRIDLSLKGSVDEDGQSITLANLDDATKETVVSKVDMELIPTRDQADEKDDATVPDVTGLTEGVVRRLLNSVGLRLEAINQSLGEDARIPVGQSMRQAPKAGSNLARNGSVLVVFAAA